MFITVCLLQQQGKLFIVAAISTTHDYCCYCLRYHDFSTIFRLSLLLRLLFEIAAIFAFTVTITNYYLLRYCYCHYGVRIPLRPALLTPVSLFPQAAPPNKQDPQTSNFNAPQCRDAGCGCGCCCCCSSGGGGSRHGSDGRAVSWRVRTGRGVQLACLEASTRPLS